METPRKLQQIKICRDIKSGGAGCRDNAKVKVQWIQNHLVNKVTNPPHLGTAEEVVENVEYLEAQPPSNVRQSTTTSSSTSDDCTFYPNAVQCLIALYGDKYSQFPPPEHCVWAEISKEMNECYFAFDEQQVQHKFCQLRQQYFEISSLSDIKACDYFHSLHSIYGDKRIEALTLGEKADFAGEVEKHCYPDEALYQEEADVKEQPKRAVNGDNLKTAPVAEVTEVTTTTTQEQLVLDSTTIDMVEKELQAMEEGNSCHPSIASPPTEEELVSNEMIPHYQEEIVQHVDEQEKKKLESQPPQVKQPPTSSIQKIFIKRELQQMENQSSTLPAASALGKRFKFEGPPKGTTHISRYPPLEVRLAKQAFQQQERPITNSPSPTMQTNTSSSTAVNFSPLALSDYNEAQERRHREKMDLMRQSLALQERSIEIQRQLLEQLINRLESGD